MIARVTISIMESTDADNGSNRYAASVTVSDARRPRATPVGSFESSDQAFSSAMHSCGDTSCHAFTLLTGRVFQVP